MKLYNTLTRQVEELTPLAPPAIAIYTCGPTVYDYAHIGHWFNYVRMDTLIRVLKADKLQTKWVMNITDVGHLVSDADDGEDKLEKGARREGKTAWQVAEFYTRDFMAGMQLLNILQPDAIVRATDHIPEQIALIEQLESKGFTYKIDDGIYYDTSKFEGYASFAKLDLDEQQTSERISLNPQKRNQSDFALWKFSPASSHRDMEWDSPWGKGFPGWHIECSAMSMKYLGETLDIHTGGIDHIPVHHTNEIAQSEAVTGKRLANYWLHSNHVMVEGQKISKSLGNGISLGEITDRGVPVEAVRLHILESHYRKQAQFSWNNLAAAHNRLNTYRAMADQYWQTSEAGELSDDDLQPFIEKIRDVLLDDLNTPEALAELSALETAVDSSGIKTSARTAYGELLEQVELLLGLRLAKEDISGQQKKLIQDRDAARQNQEWARSDIVRDQLLEQGIGLKDTVRGAIWYWL